MNNNYHDSNFDAMPGRRLQARWVLTGALKLETAAHFGGQGNSALDMPILRCARTEQPLLVGTSLAGALRAYTLDRLAGYGLASEDKESVDWKRIDKNQVANLFGGARGDDDGSQSPLIIFDALGLDTATEIRDGVTIDSACGTAAEHKKFDFEVLPPGMTFDIRFDLLVSPEKDEPHLLALLCMALEGLTKGDIHLGMRRSRGLGRITCSNWKARRFDLSNSEGWIEWIRSDHKQPTSLVSEDATCPLRAIEQAGGSIDPENTDHRNRIIIEAEAELAGELLIRSPATDAGAPDVAYLSSGGKPVLSGSSLAGVIRAQASRIAQFVHSLTPEEAEKKWIEPLFGPRSQTNTNPNFKPKGSRLHISESRINGGDTYQVTRVAIDRFTQGVVPHALFDEQPQVGGAIRLHFEIRNPRDGEIGIVLLVIKDLFTGCLPVGGSSSVGRGVLIGRQLIISGHGIANPIQATFDAAEVPKGHVPQNNELNKLVETFIQVNSTQSKEVAQ